MAKQIGPVPAIDSSFNRRNNCAVPDVRVRFLDLPAQYATLADEMRAAVDEVFGAQAFILGARVAGFDQAGKFLAHVGGGDSLESMDFGGAESTGGGCCGGSCGSCGTSQN